MAKFLFQMALLTGHQFAHIAHKKVIWRFWKAKVAHFILIAFMCLSVWVTT